MELGAAARMAEELMAHHGLSGWTLVWDRARTRAGVCRPQRREIGLSRVLTPLHTPEGVRDTVLHEIAHALVGAEHGHDAVWRRTALAIGCSGQRCTSPDEERPTPPWQGRCPRGHVTGRYRRPTRLVSCGRCHRSFDPSALLVWTHRGRLVPMGAAYDRQLRALHRAPVTAGAPGASGRQAQLVLPLGEAAPPAAQLPRTTVRLHVGERARVLGGGRYAGVVGRVRTVGRTRYHLETAQGVLTVPFALAAPAQA